MDGMKVQILYGHSELVETCRFDAENNRLVLGGYSIHYDEHGNERSRGKDEATGYLIYGESGKKSQTVPSWYRRLWEMISG